MSTPSPATGLQTKEEEENPGPAQTHNEDPFDTILDLEENLYTTAYSLGVADGAHAGRIEGRIFGLEKGFEKFATMGQLHGRACVWGSRLPSLNVSSTKDKEDGRVEKDGKPEVEVVVEIEIGSGDSVTTKEPTTEQEPSSLALLKETERLRKNITALHALTDPLTFSTLNTEDAVADFDDRVKRAGAKAKIIERTIGETSAPDPSGSPSRGGDAVKSPKKGRSVRVSGEEKEKKKGVEDSMEDFAGSRFLA